MFVLENYNDKGQLHGEQYIFTDEFSMERFDTYDNNVLTHRILKQDGVLKHVSSIEDNQKLEKVYYDNGQLRRDKLVKDDNILIYIYEYLSNGILYQCVDNRDGTNYQLYLEQMKVYDDSKNPQQTNSSNPMFIETKITIDNIKRYIPDFNQRIKNINNAKYCSYTVLLNNTILDTYLAEIVEQTSWYQFILKRITDGAYITIPFYNIVQLQQTL